MDILGLKGYTYEEVKGLIDEYVISLIAELDLDIKFIDSYLHGSRLRGCAKNNSDLDYVFEYIGDIKEDSVFNIMNEKPYYIENILADINPIRKEESGSLEKYKLKSKDYDKNFLKDMNKKQIYESIMQSVSKEVKKTLNEFRDQLPIGFYTDEERELQKKELERKKLNRKEEDSKKIEQIVDLKKKATIENALFCVIVDDLMPSLKQRLINSETIGVNIIPIDQESSAIICYSLDDFISIVKMMDGKYDQISCRAIAKF